MEFYEHAAPVMCCDCRGTCIDDCAAALRTPEKRSPGRMLEPFAPL